MFGFLTLNAGVDCCRTKPLSVRHGMGRDEHDQEGRLITAEYPTVYVVNAYIPNSGEGLKRLDYRLQQWDVHFAEYLQQLAAKKPVVLTGDLNCAHQEIDIHAPKKNLRSPGFTQVYIHAVRTAIVVGDLQADAFITMQRSVCLSSIV